MGVVYLFLYLLGAGMVTLEARQAILSAMERVAPLDGLMLVGLGAMVVLGAAVVHGLVQRRRGDIGVFAMLPDFRGSHVLWGLGLWMGPLLLAWGQFECHVEPVTMFPMVSIAGAGLLVLALAGWLLGDHAWRWPLGAVAVSLLGLPLGLLSEAMAVRHFHTHLTDVESVVFSGDAHSPGTFALTAQEPQMPLELEPLGEETMGLIRAFAQARPVVVQDEIAAGRMRYDEAGALVVVHDDGSETPVQAFGQSDQESSEGAAGADAVASEVAAMFEQAREADAPVAARARAEKRAAFEAHIRAQKRGGRLFGFDPGD